MIEGALSSSSMTSPTGRLAASGKVGDDIHVHRDRRRLRVAGLVKLEQLPRHHLDGAPVEVHESGLRHDEHDLGRSTILRTAGRRRYRSARNRAGRSSGRGEPCRRRG
jgi:hypothetical protein